MSELLRVTGLEVGFPAAGTEVLRSVDLVIGEDESVALTGPSGSGKTLLARAVLGLLPDQAEWRGEISWRGRSLSLNDPASFAQVRGPGMTLVMQEPGAALDPVMTVGEQIAETVRLHHGLGRAHAAIRTRELLGEMMLEDPDRVAASHPHQLSGGQRQRALLAAALACDPQLLIADEPTTSLDVLVQKQILAVLARVRRRRRMAMLFISHDIDLVALVADRTVKLKDGRLEACPTAASGPPVRIDSSGDPQRHPDHPVAIEVSHVSVAFGREKSVPALSDVSLTVAAGETLGIAGASGSGKTTLARAMAGHQPIDSGRITVAGQPWRSGSRQEQRLRRRRVQLLFQDPGGSLNPRQKIGRAVEEGGCDDVPALLSEVGLPPETADRHPHELSGGQRQRAALARCLAADPAVLIADEPTTALDHETRSRVLRTLESIRERRGLSLVMVSHELPLLEQVCGRVVVMLAGVIVEIYPSQGGRPMHPYSRRLWAAAPTVMREVGVGDDDSADTGFVAHGEFVAGAGCPYVGSCKYQTSQCLKQLPPLKRVSERAFLRCPVVEDMAGPLFIDT